MKKILIVDDVEIIRKLLTIQLRDHYYVDDACNADEAWDKIHFNKPDLIILDIQMPNGSMNGYELCEKIKADPAVSDIYVIMLTGDWRTVQKAGDDFKGDDYTFKPFTKEEVLTMVEKAFNPQHESA